MDRDDGAPDDGGLGAPPPEDSLALSFAQARIAEKLFGAGASIAAPVVVGRYRLLEQVGRGGMGMVWGAWDPELERRVAIKLLDTLKPAARDRLLGEARALAKLSHPNIVPVYDVGVVDDRVYLVMEWVVGDDLRKHLADARSVRAIVEVALQAARGLAAVHEAGLIHRDFKPENAIVGRDGRVRVLDFGLARGDIESAGGIAGTPRYMAPEQAAGAVLTAAVDQYALCVVVREALERRGGELPRHLAAVIARGTASDPAARFATMTELIDALGRDPARTLRRRIAVGSALGAVGVAFAIGTTRSDVCTDAPPGAPDRALRARAIAHVTGLGGFAAREVPTLVTSLDQTEHAWKTAHHAACTAHGRGELTTRLYERRLTCLARASAALHAATEILEHTTLAAFPDAQIAIGALPEPALCTAVDQSLIASPPASIEPEVRAAAAAIERARMFATALRADAIEVATAARATAEATSYPPIIARALLVEGRARMALDDDDAATTLERAARAGWAAGDDVLAVEAFARFAYMSAITTGRVVDGLSVVDALAERLAPEGRFAKLLWLNNLAAVRLATGDPAAARALLERAIRDWRPGGGEDAYELISIPQNLALVSDRPSESLAQLDRAHAEITRVLGRDHPKAIAIDLARAVFVGDLAAARHIQDGACARLASLFPHLGDERTDCEYGALWLADEANDEAGTTAHAVATHFDATEPVRAALVAAHAKPEPATEARAEHFERLARGAPTDSTWTQLAAADAFVAAATTWQRLDRMEDAERCWLAALSLYDKARALPRRLARTRVALATLLRDRDPASARAHAAAALAWYRASGTPPVDLSQLEAMAR